MRTHRNIVRADIIRLLLAAALALALAFTLSCSDDPDEDGDGSFKMSGERNTIGYYEYTIYNRSDWQISVTLTPSGKSSQTKTINAGNFYIFTYTSDSEVTVKYSPTDKVRAERGSAGKVYFYNK